MPRFRGSCGCYNKQDAREIGLVPAIVWNDMIDRSEHFDMNPMWYDQKDAADRLGIEYHRLNRAVKNLEEIGRISTKVGYRPGTLIRTTWVTIITEEIPYSNSSNVQNDDFLSNEQNEISILNETKKRDSTAEMPVVVFLRVNPSGKKNGWKSQRVYSTQEEVDRLESMDPEETIDFKFWKAPKMVGDDTRAKFKRLKAKLVQPDVQDEDTTEDTEGEVNLWQ